MLRKLQLFLKLGPAAQLQFVYLWMCLMKVWVQLQVSGLKFFSRRFTTQPQPPAQRALSRAQLNEALFLSRGVSRAARYTPWNSTCLMQVLLLQQLLAERGIPGYLSLGARTQPGESGRQLHAHAWLCCGDTIVHGEAPDKSYQTLATYSWCANAEHNNTRQLSGDAARSSGL